MAEEKKVKYYNPYPFPVRLMNDLDKLQALAPQGHCKVRKNRYEQSKLDLPLWDQTGEKVYRPGLDIDLDKLLKSNLVDLAWAVIAGDRLELDGKSKGELIVAIREKVGMEKVPDGEKEAERVKKKNDKRKELEVASPDKKADEDLRDKERDEEPPPSDDLTKEPEAVDKEQKKE